jgi:hypothetical protein
MKFGFGFICLGDYPFTCLMHSGLKQNVIFKAVTLIRTVSSYINMFALKFSIFFTCGILYLLTFNSVAITLRTTRFNVQKFCMVLTLCVCVLYGSHN